MNDDPIIFLLYENDLFLTREENIITDCKKNLIAKFEMKDLGWMHYFISIKVWKRPEKIFLNQGKYVVEILNIFDMLECKPMNTPMKKKLKLLVDIRQNWLMVHYIDKLLVCCRDDFRG
jgi:hypothetical protein